MPRGSGHVHKYQRVNASSKKNKEWIVYRCVLPKCTHYILPAFVSGKESICFACSEHFIIGTHNRDQVKLKCNACTTKEQKGGTPLAKTPAVIVAGAPPIEEDVLSVGDDAIDRLLKKLGPQEE